MSAPGEVSGNFDWIVDFHYLIPFFEVVLSDVSVSPRLLTALVVGSGTSTLSHSLCTNLEFGKVVSVDNDADCIEYMRQQYANVHNMKWVVYDMIERSGVGYESEIQPNSFDIIVDKGSLDAMLVEGAIATMLCEVYRLLRPGGYYFLCSLHAPCLLRSLLEAPPLQFELTFPVLENRADCNVDGRDGECRTVVLCKKVTDHPSIDIISMSEAERRIMDEFYKHSVPLLTAERIAEISDIYTSRQCSSIPLKELHRLVFREDSGLGYTYDLFTEDLVGFSLQKPGEMSLDEILDFISSRQ